MKGKDVSLLRRLRRLRQAQAGAQGWLWSRVGKAGSGARWVRGLWSQVGEAALAPQHSTFGSATFSSVLWLGCTWRTCAFPMHSARRGDTASGEEGRGQALPGSCPGDLGGALSPPGPGQMCESRGRCRRASQPSFCSGLCGDEELRASLHSGNKYQ